ncbi:unnamed protein product [Caenorhabditis brenneri]
MTFPLLRLPLLASIAVIKNTHVKYLIPFIQLSKKAKNLVKVSKVHIKLAVFQSSIQFQKLADQKIVRRLELFNSSEKMTDIPFTPPFDLKFENITQFQIGAYKKLMDDFVEFFEVCSVSFDLQSTCSYTSLCFMEHARGLGLQISTARVMIGGANPGVYRSLLDVCSNASQLLVHFDTEEPFTFNGFDEYRTHKLRFVPKERGINGFTVDQMCALINCSEVSVEDLRWSNEDYNRLIKFWMTSDGNLKSWKLWTYRANIIPWAVLNGINNTQIRPHTYEIQRVDGVKAEVVLSFSTCTLKVIDA